jgi:hypothetical protein
VAQRAVDHERIDGHLGLEALRQDDLVDVSRGDVRLRRSHLLLELLAGVIRPQIEPPVAVRVRMRQASLELALQELDLRAGELVQRLEIRGRSGTNGARKFAINPRSVSTNPASLSVVSPPRSMVVRPPCACRMRNGSLPRTE